MDAYDLFKQLTRGARFTKKRTTERTINQNLNKEKKPKLEIEETNNNNANEIVPLSEAVQSNTENIEQSDTCDFGVIYGNTSIITPISNSKPYRKTTKKLKTEKERQKHREEEMILTIRKENNIHVIGKSIPPPFQNFEELHDVYNVSERLVTNLVNCNYAKPTPIQMQAIPVMLKGRNILACAPTGSGKTIAFLTPIIHDLKVPKKDGFRALVLAPTRELAQQIYRECVRLCEKTALKIHIISKVNQAKQKFGNMSSKKFDILISTPNRIRYLLKQQPPILDLRSIKWFVIDEADRLMEDGQNNFKEQLEDILSACAYPKKTLALFSATCTVPVAKWAVRNLKQLIRVTIGIQNTTTEDVEQELMFVGSESGKLLAIRDLVHKGLKPPVLIFLQSKDRAKQLFDELLYDGINVDIIHADRTQQQRDNCVKAFREGHIWVLICTELMGRGIDFKGVNLVINYDFPPSVISYIHRIGRTGRAGRPGKAITFYTHDDTPRLRSIAEIIQKSGGEVPEFMLTLKKTTKAEKKKLNNIIPKREDISTKVKLPVDQSKVKKQNMKTPCEDSLSSKQNTLPPPKKGGKGKSSKG